MRSAPYALVIAAALVAATPAAGDPPANVGSGLRELLEPLPGRGGFKITTDQLVIRDRAGRVLVDVYARDGASLPAVRSHSRRAGLTVTTTSRDARALEGFVAVGDVVALAAAKGVASVSAALRPYRNAGAATSQGVVAERVDRLPRGVDGLGITVGVLSDSYDTATTDLFGGPTSRHAADDVRPATSQARATRAIRTR